MTCHRTGPAGLGKSAQMLSPFSPNPQPLWGCALASSLRLGMELSYPTGPLLGLSHEATVEAGAAKAKVWLGI